MFELTGLIRQENQSVQDIIRTTVKQSFNLAIKKTKNVPKRGRLDGAYVMTAVFLFQNRRAYIGLLVAHAFV